MTHRYYNCFWTLFAVWSVSQAFEGGWQNSQTPIPEHQGGNSRHPKLTKNWRPLATRRPYSSTYVYNRIQILFFKTNSDILKRAPSLLEPVLQLVILAVTVAGCVQWLEIFKRQCALQSLSLKYRLCADPLSPRDPRLSRDGFSSNFISVTFY